MALQLLARVCPVHRVSHDLESFYWVLLWVVLRHTAHRHPAKDQALPSIFTEGDDWSAAGAKAIWLGGSTKLVIPKNKPLTKLMEKYRLLARDNWQSHHRSGKSLTYEAVEEIFVTALASKGWPTDDKALPFPLPDTHTHSVQVGDPEESPKEPRIADRLKRKARPRDEDATEAKAVKAVKVRGVSRRARAPKRRKRG